MTKKEIIIDGVNMGECPISRKCAEFANCKIRDILQQLASKTQECEEQRTRIEYYLTKTKQMLDDIDNKDRFNSELQQECEALKKQLDKQVKDASNRYSELNREWNNRCKKIDYDLKSLNRYRKAMEEIEGIAANLRTRTDYHSEKEVNADIDNVLDIINKAKGE